MAYGQKNYLEIIGHKHPTLKNYRMDQTGCFLFFFVNMLNEKFGIKIDPLEMNRRFKEANVYVDAPPKDGLFDDLAWNSITRIFPEITVGQIGTGNPPKVKGTFGVMQHLRPGVVHFSLVDHHDDSGLYIVDSNDGNIKNATAYGPVLAWASFNFDRAPSQAIQVDPVPPPVQPASPPVVAPQVAAPIYDGEFVTLQEGWGLSHAARAAGFSDWGTENRWNEIARLNGAANWQAMTGRLFKGTRLKVGASMSPSPTPSMTPQHLPPADMVDPGTPPVPPADIIPVTVKPPSDWKTITPERKVYVSIAPATIINFEPKPGDPGDLFMPGGKRIRSVGTFVRHGKTYVLTDKSYANGWWYGIDRNILAEARPAEEDKEWIDRLLAEDDDLGDLGNLDEVEEERRELQGGSKTREHFIDAVGVVQSFFIRIGQLLTPKFLKKQKVKG